MLCTSHKTQRTTVDDDEDDEDDQLMSQENHDARWLFFVCTCVVVCGYIHWRIARCVGGVVCGGEIFVRALAPKK